MGAGNSIRVADVSAPGCNSILSRRRRVRSDHSVTDLAASYSSEYLLWFGPECDVLVTCDSRGLLVCSMCALDGQARPFVTMSDEAMSSHLDAHRAVGDKVPLVDLR